MKPHKKRLHSQTNYDKLGGGAGSTQSWIAAGNQSERFPKVVRNSSFYPWFGARKTLLFQRQFCVL